jgi:hypothetical protein
MSEEKREIFRRKPSIEDMKNSLKYEDRRVIPNNHI